MDSAGKIVRCFQAAAREAGLEPPPDHKVRNIIGLGLNEALDILLPGVDESTRHHVVECYRHHFLNVDETATPLFPGVVEGLQQLSDRGFRLAIATGKARRGLDRVLRDTAISHHFCASRCADEARSKPHPQMLYDLLNSTGVNANRSLMVGDTTYDLQMALAAAVGSVAVTYGAHERELLLSHSPLACVDSFPNVCRWLEAAS